MKGLIIAGGIFAVLAVVVVILVASVIGWSNGEIKLRNQVLAQEQVNETVFDNTWKTISQEAQVSNQYKDSFKAVYVDIMNARYASDRSASLMKWVTESNPNFSTDLFGKLMVTIEAQRQTFTENQKKLVDLSREHNNMIQVFPGSLWASILGRQAIPITLVTSAKTEDAFKTGQDNDVQLPK